MQIDFGFSELGYQAFHTILGDVPTRRERNGTITAVPKVMDRGSVGSAGAVAPRIADLGSRDDSEHCRRSKRVPA